MFFCVALAFILNLILTPVVIFLSRRFGWYDTMNSRKMHNGKVPRLGGLSLILSTAIAFSVYMVFFSDRDYSAIIPILAAAMVIYLAGVLDDFVELPAKIKLLFQVITALIVSLGPLHFEEFFIFKVNDLTGRGMTFVWVIAIINAYNLIDGIDLLCSGLCFLTHLTLGILLVFCSPVNAVLCFILCASIFSFMIFNRPPAKIFLGDSGSQFLGYSIAVIPLIYDFASFEDVKAAVMAVLVSIPVIDVFAAVWRRTREHRSIFSADRAHIHHKLINIGFSRKRTLMVLFFIQIITCLSVLAGLFMDTFSQRFTLLAVDFMFVLGIFAILHYVNRIVNMKMLGKLPEEPQW